MSKPSPCTRHGSNRCGTQDVRVSSEVGNSVSESGGYTYAEDTF